MVEAAARYSAARTMLNTLMNGTNNHTAGFVWPWMRAYAGFASSWPDEPVNQSGRRRSCARSGL